MNNYLLMFILFVVVYLFYLTLTFFKTDDGEKEEIQEQIKKNEEEQEKIRERIKYLENRHEKVNELFNKSKKVIAEKIYAHNKGNIFYNPVEIVYKEKVDKDFYFERDYDFFKIRTEDIVNNRYMIIEFCGKKLKTNNNLSMLRKELSAIAEFIIEPEKIIKGDKKYVSGYVKEENIKEILKDYDFNDLYKGDKK